jgi:hypothetical protein
MQNYKEVRLQDLVVGKKYKLKHCFDLKERVVLPNDPKYSLDTSQVDIDTICSRFLELSEKTEIYLDLRFKLPKGERISIPEEQNRPTGTRNYIYLNPLVMEEAFDADGEASGIAEVAFLEEVQNNKNMSGGQTLSGGRRKRKLSKKRKTRKQKRSTR